MPLALRSETEFSFYRTQIKNKINMDFNFKGENSIVIHPGSNFISFSCVPPWFNLLLQYDMKVAKSEKKILFWIVIPVFGERVKRDKKRN